MESISRYNNFRSHRESFVKITIAIRNNSSSINNNGLWMYDKFQFSTRLLALRFFSFFFFQILEKMKLENASPTYESIVAKETSFSRQVSRESTSFNDDVWREVIFTLRLRSRAIKIGLLIRTRRKLKVRFTSVSTGALTRFSPRQWFSSRSLPRLIKSLFALTLREIDVFVKQFWLFPPC